MFTYSEIEKFLKKIEKMQCLHNLNNFFSYFYFLSIGLNAASDMSFLKNYIDLCKKEDSKKLFTKKMKQYFYYILTNKYNYFNYKRQISGNKHEVVQNIFKDIFVAKNPNKIINDFTDDISRNFLKLENNIVLYDYEIEYIPSNLFCKLSYMQIKYQGNNDGLKFLKKLDLSSLLLLDIYLESNKINESFLCKIVKHVKTHNKTFITIYNSNGQLYFFDKVINAYIDSANEKKVKFDLNLNTMDVYSNEKVLPMFVENYKNINRIFICNKNIDIAPMYKRPLLKVNNIYIRKSKFSCCKFFTHNFPNLENLYLDNVDLNSFLQNINDLNFLKKLIIEQHHINSITMLKLINSLSSFKNLRSLSLPNNNIKNIPKVICNLKNVNFLDLRKNNLKNIKFIKNMNNLEELCISNNYLTEISDELFNTNSLIHLHINSNPIEYISPNINKLKKLTISKDQKHLLPKNYGIKIDIVR